MRSGRAGEVEHGGPTPNGGTGDDDAAARRVLGVGDNGIKQDVCCGSVPNLNGVGGEVTFDVDIANGAFGGAVERQRTVQNNGQCGSARFAIGRDAKDGERAIELRQVASVQVEDDVGERVTVVHAEHALRCECGARCLKIDLLYVDDLRAPVIVREDASTHGHIRGVRAVLAEGLEVQVCTDLHAGGNVV